MLENNGSSPIISFVLSVMISFRPIKTLFEPVSSLLSPVLPTHVRYLRPQNLTNHALPKWSLGSQYFRSRGPCVTGQ